MHLRSLECLVINFDCCLLLTTFVNKMSRFMYSLNIPFSILGDLSLPFSHVMIPCLRLPPMHQVWRSYALLCDMMHYSDPILLLLFLYRSNTIILVKVKRHIGLNFFKLTIVSVVRNHALFSEVGIIQTWWRQWIGVLFFFIEVSCRKTSTTSAWIILNDFLRARTIRY